jgi:hypothetical protein
MEFRNGDVSWLLTAVPGNALIAAAILAHAERQLLPVNRIDQEPDTALITIAIPTGWPVVFCVSILLLYTAFSLAHVFYNNINI